MLDALLTDWVFALRPQLPPGKGGLILMLGGVTVLWTALFWLMVTPKRALAIQPIVGGTHAGRPARRPETAWRSIVEAASRKAHLGQVDIVRAAPDRCLVLLRSCRSCRRHAPRRGCRSEQRRLARALGGIVGPCRVVESQCRAGGRGECTFLVAGGR